MKRAAVTEKILDYKRNNELTWKAIADEIGGYSQIFIITALLGNMPLPKAQAAKAGKLFKLSPEEEKLLTEIPMRAEGITAPPTDPTLYRFYEAIIVFGPALKEQLHEQGKEARKRFIEEVETGKHPRLPRTQPQARNVPVPGVPPAAEHDSLDVVLEARVSDLGYILKVNRIQGSGNDDVDRAAAMAAYRASLVYGGEMGVGVPCSMLLTYHFNRGTVTAEAKPADPPMWREWVWPPDEPR